MTRTKTHSDKASEIHISEGEALRLDFPTVLALVRKGARIVIDSDSSHLPVAVFSSFRVEAIGAHEPFWRLAPDAVEAVPAAPSAVLPSLPSRKLSEVIALLPENSPAVMDADFARDVEEAIASHREPLKSAWD